MLKALLAEMDDAAKAKDVKRYHGLNLEFHDVLVDFAASSSLSETYRRLIKELLLFRMRGLDEGGGLRSRSTNTGRSSTPSPRGDPDRAGRVMRAHVADSRARMHKATDAPTRQTAEHFQVKRRSTFRPKEHE